jgi:trigger factor
VKTSVTELPDSRVRVDVDVEPDDVEERLERTALGLGRELRVPGFRKGKVPAAVVLQRLGREAVLEQTVRDALPEWYERALLESGVSPVGDPEIAVTSAPQEAGEPLGLSIEVAVRPKARLGDYKGLEVGRPEPEVPEDIVERELERLGESLARLEPVERQAGAGDFMVVDFHGEIDGQPFEGGEAHDYLLELGSGQLIEGFEEQLRGLGAGEHRDVEITFPSDYRPERLAGQAAVFHVDVKEVREKVLPELDDGFAAEASEFDTLEELRDDLRRRLRAAAERQIESDFREAVVDAAAEKATIELPEDVVAGRAEERWGRVERTLTGRGLSPDSFLKMQGKTREEVIAESHPDAERELKREAVLEAVVEAEGIEVTEDEVLDALRDAAEADGSTPEKVLARLRERGRDKLIAEDLRLRKAVDVLAEAAKPIPMGQAEARERLWTPEKEREERGALWTPGSE